MGDAACVILCCRMYVSSDTFRHYIHQNTVFLPEKMMFWESFQNNFDSHKSICNSTQTHSTPTLYNHSCLFEISENSFKIDKVH